MNRFVPTTKTASSRTPLLLITLNIITISSSSAIIPQHTTTPPNSFLMLHQCRHLPEATSVRSPRLEQPPPLSFQPHLSLLCRIRLLPNLVKSRKRRAIPRPSYVSIPQVTRPLCPIGSATFARTLSRYLRPLKRTFRPATQRALRSSTSAR